MSSRQRRTVPDGGHGQAPLSVAVQYRLINAVLVRHLAKCNAAQPAQVVANASLDVDALGQRCRYNLRRRGDALVVGADQVQLKIPVKST